MVRSKSVEIDYSPGASLNLIQARKSLEEQSKWRLVEIENIGEEVITLSSNGVGRTFRCVDAVRLKQIVNSKRVPHNDEGVPIVIFGNYNVLIIPCADAGQTMGNDLPVNSSVVYLENGAALFSPTTNGAWHLFSLGDIS